jgi:hypothetical protein
MTLPSALSKHNYRYKNIFGCDVDLNSLFCVCSMLQEGPKSKLNRTDNKSQTIRLWSPPITHTHQSPTQPRLLLLNLHPSIPWFQKMKLTRKKIALISYLSSALYLFSLSPYYLRLPPWASSHWIIAKLWKLKVLQFGLSLCHSVWGQN